MDIDALRVLDCTLRDGGYYNDWDFDPELVDAYLRALSASGVDFVEIGFRFTQKPRFLGPYAYTTDAFLETVEVPNDLTLGVMINANDALSHPDGPERAVRQLFRPREASKVSLVRVAAHLREVPECGPVVRTLRDLGYRVGFNLMQSSGCDDDRLAELAAIVRDFGAVEVLYFADSLGNMGPEDVGRIIAALRRTWAGPLGFHGHDNMGRGVANTLAAAERGVTWLDATVTGMGRGAGNTQMEYLLAELHRRGSKSLAPEPVIDLAVRSFRDLKRKHDWGANVFYYLGAMHGVHPTYVQEMLSQDTFAPNDIAFLIEMVGKTRGGAYSSKGLFEALMARFTEEEGAFSVAGRFRDRPVLLVAGGAGAQRHWKAIERFIDEKDAAVITLNHLPFVPIERTTAIAVCHPGRIVSLVNRANLGASTPLLVPFASLPKPLGDRLRHLTIWDYGMTVEESAVRAGASGCAVPRPLVAPYALCAAIAGGASEIYLAGFDGYDGRDPRFHEMNDTLELVQAAHPAVPVISLTATHYDVQRRSIYSF